MSNIIAQPAEIISDNGTIKVKLDLTRGGVISYISPSGSNRNLVNNYDEGRYIQQSYYAGNRIDRRSGGQSPYWSPWPWNPIQVGDYFRHRANILDYKQSSNTLYVKCIPMLWDMNNVPAEAVMEQSVVLEGSTLKIHNKLTCNRTDTIYGENVPNYQELPAVYVISALDRLFGYVGQEPFTSDSVAALQVVNLSSGFWGIYPSVTEHWMAFVNSNNWGIGIYNPDASLFFAGIAGVPGGETTNSSTSYISPSKIVTLNKNSVFEYDYYVIVGSVDEIRRKIYELNLHSTVVDNQFPDSYLLSQNYPNPFNPTTTIRYSIPKQGLVTLKVYNLLGQEIATLVNNEQVAGNYTVDFNAANLVSGVYVYRLDAGNASLVKKLLMLK